MNDLNIEGIAERLKNIANNSDTPTWVKTELKLIIRDLDQPVSTNTSSIFTKKEEKTMLPPFEFYGELSVGQGLDIIRNYGERVVNTKLVNTPTGDRILTGSVSIQSVKVPKYSTVNSNSIIGFVTLECLYPNGAEDGDTSVTVLLNTILSCELSEEGKLTFWYTESGRTKVINFFFVPLLEK